VKNRTVIEKPGKKRKRVTKSNRPLKSIAGNAESKQERNVGDMQKAG